MWIRIVKIKGRWRDKRKVILMLIVMGIWSKVKGKGKVGENVIVNYKINK